MIWYDVPYMLTYTGFQGGDYYPMTRRQIMKVCIVKPLSEL